MRREHPDPDEARWRLMHALADSAEEASAAEIAAELRAAGEDPEAVGEAARALLTKAVGRERLARARREHRSSVARIEGQSRRLPASPGGRRRLLEKIFRADPALLQAALTLQFRELSDLPDEDVESALRQLAALGAVDAFLDEELEEPGEASGGEEP